MEAEGSLQCSQEHVWICFRPQVMGCGTSILLHPLEIAYLQVQ
jgi:hypothetical protein